MSGDLNNGSPMDPPAGANCCKELVKEFRKLNIDPEGGVERSMGIMCYMGPSTNDVDILQQMIESGMTMALIDCLRDGDHKLLAEIIQKIRVATDRVSSNLHLMYPVAIALKTKGFQIYTGINKHAGALVLVTGEMVAITTDEQYKKACTKEMIYVDNPQFLNPLRTRHRIYINNGAIRLKVVSVEMMHACATCVVYTGGSMPSKSWVTLPDSVVETRAVTEDDLEDIEFAVEQKLDAIFVSKVQFAGDLVKVHESLDGRTQMMIGASVESEMGFANIDDIIKAADAIMITRGYAGMKLSTWNVLLASKVTVAKCKSVGKPSVLMTKLLHPVSSQHQEPMLTDMTNTAQILQEGADSLCMDCGDSPGHSSFITSMKILIKTCKDLNTQLNAEELIEDICDITLVASENAHAVSLSAVTLSLRTRAAAIIVLTTSGGEAKRVATLRPLCAIIAVTRSRLVSRQLLFFKGVHPLFYLAKPVPDYPEDVDARIQFGITYGKYRGIIRRGDIVIVMHALEDGTGNTNTVRFMYAGGLNIDSE